MSEVIKSSRHYQDIALESVEKNRSFTTLSSAVLQRRPATGVSMPNLIEASAKKSDISSYGSSGWRNFFQFWLQAQKAKLLSTAEKCKCGSNRTFYLLVRTQLFFFQIFRTRFSKAAYIPHPPRKRSRPSKTRQELFLPFWLRVPYMLPQLRYCSGIAPQLRRFLSFYNLSLHQWL